MKLQSSPSSEEPEINVISLVDVLLVLVLFFMVSTTFMRETEIALRLPQADAAAAPAERGEMLEITVTRDGNSLVDGRALRNNEQRTLRAAIEALAGERRDMPVVIRGDADANLQSVITAMETAGQLGFVDLDIVTVTPPAD
jgi:biopolymer transport protein ExbD